MQQMWTEVDQFIDSHLIPDDRCLGRTVDNTAHRGLPEHLAVAPNQGMLLQMLIQMNNCKRILELGTFAAYSTVWLARALGDEGYVLTIEGREAHAAVAQENIEHSGLAAQIDLKVGRAADILNELIKQNAEPFDFIFIDADKQSYSEYLELSLNLSRSGTLIFMDNVIRAGEIINPENKKPSIEGIRDLFEALKNHPRLLSSTALQTVGSKGHDGFALAIVK